MLPFKSLDAASATGAGATKDLEAVLVHHSMAVSATGNPTNVVVALDGSHDGVAWFAIGTVNAPASALPTAVAAQHGVRHVRARLVELTGGSSPTVTATIASA